MYICIAGKNICAIDALKYLLYRNINRGRILVLPNDNDIGKSSWQPSLKKFAITNNIKIARLEKLYEIKELFFFSLEYDKIINIDKFKSNNLFNFHFSLLPKYRGCHTNFIQIYKGEKFSGVTLHKIDKGIDTGAIVDQIRFKIGINDTAYKNYIRLMKYSTKLFKKNLFYVLNNKFKLKRQKLSIGSYYSRKSINYKNIYKFNVKNITINTHNKIRSLIFPPYQFPIVNGSKIVKSLYKNKKVYLIKSNVNK